MTDFFTLATALKAGEWIVKDFLGPTAKDFCQDSLEGNVARQIAQQAPEPLKKAIFNFWCARTLQDPYYTNTLQSV